MECVRQTPYMLTGYLLWGTSLVTGKLISLIDQFCGQAEGLVPTAIPHLTLFRATIAEVPIERAPDSAAIEPSLCVVVQGSKQATLGTRPFLYRAGHYSLITVDLPATNILVDATPASPFLGLTLKLDPDALGDMVLAVPSRDGRQPPSWGMTPSPLDGHLTDSLTRLVTTLRNRQDVAVLAPLIEREVTYRLLCGPQGSLLRQIAHADSRLSQIRKAIGWIRENYAEPIRIDDAADIAGMSLSTFHEHFKTVTSMSPLQYQKHLRLHAARRQIVTGQADAGTAAFNVGYDSPSQFNREYKRLFGAPPRRDLSRLRKWIAEESWMVA